MIKQLFIKNFKSHISTKLDFDSGVNVIIPLEEKNPNAIGKTNIFRAIHWLVFNRPISSSRVLSNLLGRDGLVIVRATFDKVVVKLKKKIKEKKVVDAEYSVRINNEVESFRKFKTSVPDSVEKALSLSEINFALQLDEPFLITSGNSKISKEINKITKLEDVDNWISSLNSRIRKENNYILNKQDQIKEIEEELLKYKGLRMLGVMLKRFEKLEKEVIAREQVLADLPYEIEEIEKLDRQIESCKDLPVINLKYDERLEEVENSINEIDSLFQIDFDINDNKKEIKELKENYVKELRKNKVCPQCGSILNSEHLKMIIDGL